MPKVAEVIINKCGECPFFRKGFLSEPSECGRFPVYTTSVIFDGHPPEFCPLKEYKEDNDLTKAVSAEKEACAKLCESLANRAENRDMEQGMLLCAAFIRKSSWFR